MADETTAVLEEPVADGVTESVPPEATSTDPPTKPRGAGSAVAPAEPPVVSLDEETDRGDEALDDSLEATDEVPPPAIRPIARLGGDPDVPGTQLDYRPSSVPNQRVQPHPAPHTVVPEQPRQRAGPMTVDAVAFPRSTDPLPSFADQLEAWVRAGLETPASPPPAVPVTIDDPEPG